MDEELMDIITEENIEVADAETVEAEVSIEDEEYDISTEETAETVEVESTEEIEIEIEEAIGWVGGDSERHYSLLGRDDPNQHPIEAITGLRTELDNIEALKTVYSDKIGIANYYEWNSGSYDEFGYFVSLVPHTSTIKICEGADIFGVTVDAAAFVGNQDKDVTRDNSYALVATTGLIDVRCESAVVAGDYVVSNAHGIAEKTTSSCGYKVISVNNKEGILYASIALGVQACTTDGIGKNLNNLETRVDNNETNIATAMNTANDAYNRAVESDSVSEEAILRALEALSQANGAVDATDEMNKILESVNNTAVQAKAIAEGAVSEADRIRREAYDTANDALSNVNDLIEDLEPITQWEDPISGNVGAEYLTTYINDGLATKVEVQTVEKTTEENKSWIAKNGESIGMAVSSVDKYSVGEYSQAYGLTLEQARSILKEGMVYIPTRHGEVSTHTETYSDEDSYNFTYTFYYIWDGTKWSEGSGKVWFNKQKPDGYAYAYWYDGDKLYLLKDAEWTEVATLAGNVNNRITSMIRQDVDEVRAEVVNARGSYASLGVRVTDTETEVQNIASWTKDKNGNQYNLATIKQTADDAGASISQVVEAVGADGKVNAASIVAAVNESESSVTINANKIVLDGKAFFVDTNGNTTTIDGSSITAGTIVADQIAADAITAEKIAADAITSRNYYTKDTDGNYTTTLSGEGMKLNLEDGTWDSTNFKVASDGTVDCSNIAINDGVIKSGNYIAKPIPGDESFETITITTPRHMQTLEIESQSSGPLNRYIYKCTIDGDFSLDNTDYVIQTVTLVNNTVKYTAAGTTKEDNNAELTNYICNGNVVLFTIVFKTVEMYSTPYVPIIDFKLNIDGVKAVGYECTSGAMISFRDNTPEINFPLFSVNSDGHTISKSGQIGGYILENDVLTSGTGNTTVRLDASTDNNYAFSAGSEAPGVAPFSVTKTGVMSAAGGSFSGDVVAAQCSIGPIVFNNKSFNLSDITVGLSNFTDTSAHLIISARDKNPRSGLKGEMHYNYYNGSSWYTNREEFTTGGSAIISTTYTLSFNNATKVIYTKPFVAWTYEEVKTKSFDISTLLESGDWEERDFSTFDSPNISISYLWLHQGSVIIFADESNNFRGMYHFPLMKDNFGDPSENIITSTDTSASMVCGGGTFNSNYKPGFYLGTDGFRIGEDTGTECSIHPDGAIWCKKLYVYADNGYIDVGEKLKNL